MRIKVVVRSSLLHRGRQYFNNIGDVINVRKDNCDFTEVLVRFEDKSEIWIYPTILEITHKRVGD